MKHGRKLTSILLTLALLLALAPALGGTAKAEAWSTDQTIDADTEINFLSINGSIKLTITSNHTLTVNNGITVADGNTLTVEGPGTLIVNGERGPDDAGSHGFPGGAGVKGSLVVNGGTVTLTGGEGGTGTSSCGAGGAGVEGSLVVNGGTVTLTGGDGGAGAAGGAGVSGSLTVNGGAVTVTGGDGGSGASAGGGIAGYLALNGGAAKVTGVVGGTVSIGDGLTYTDGTDSYYSSTSSDTLKTSLNAGKTLVVLFPLWVGGVQVTGANASNVLSGGDNDDKVSYDAGTNTLTLNGVNLSGYTGQYAIRSTDTLNITLVGENTLASGNGTGANTVIYSEAGGLTITGSGDEPSLTLTAGETTGDGNNAIGIYSGGNLTINGGAKVTVTSGVVAGVSSGSEGIHCGSGGVTIEGGAKVTVIAGDADTKSNMVRGIYCNGGTLTVSGAGTKVEVIAGKSGDGTIGICSTRDAAIKGGAKVDVTAGASDHDTIGIECGVNDSGRGLTISGGATVTVTAGDAAGENGSCGILTGGNISISDDSVKKVEAKGDVALKFVNDSMTLTLTTALPGKGYSKNDATAVNIAAKTYEGAELSVYAHVIFAAESKPEPKPTPEREQREPFKQEFRSPLTFDGGKLVISPANAGIRDTVTLTAIPDAGKELKNLTVTQKGVGAVKLADKGGGVYTFAMPGGNVAFDAVFGEPETSPQTPQPAPQTPPAKPNAVLSPQKITVNGAEVTVEAYNIGGTNYFKLRDLAALLKGTPAQFNVDYDAGRNAVVMTKGAAYAGAVATEFTDKSASTVASPQTVELDGQAVELTAYNIGGSNFFGLRELAAYLGYSVDYDAATNTAIIVSR